MKKILLLLVSFIVIVIFLAQIDDDLSPEATRFIERLDTTANSEAYYYLFGIDAHESEKPEELGKQRFEEYQKLDTDSQYETVEYPPSKKIPLPKGSLFCKVRESGCLESLLSAEINIENIYRENDVLVKRSNTFLDFKEYSTLSKPTVNEQVPSYSYILAAERIKVLNAISVYQEGNPKAAVESLITQLSVLREAFALQDNLIGKLVLLSSLSEIIEVASMMLSRTELRSDKIPSLSLSERSFSRVATREFGFSYYMFKNLDRHPEIFAIGGNFPGWISRMMYKPNMTINAITPLYARLERLAQLSPTDVADEIKNGGEYRPSSSTLRNYVGDILIATASPNYDQYVVRFLDFDKKIAQFNQTYHANRD